MVLRFFKENWRRIPTVIYRKVFIENYFVVRRYVCKWVPLSSEFQFWESLQGRHNGETVVVVGNGPSLNLIDFDLLSGFTTFGSNKIFLKKDWRPTYYSVEDDLVLIQNLTEILELDGTQKIFPCGMLSLSKRIDDVTYFEFSTAKFSPRHPKFLSDTRPAPSWGSTIVYTQIQLAVWMGASKIILVGVDFNFNIPETSALSTKELVSEGEVNHFHADYRKVGEKWNVPNLHLQQLAFEKAALACAERGIELVNATPGSALSVLEIVDPREVGLAN